MTHLQKLGGIAAFINVMVVMATLATVIFLIGFSAIADPNKLIDLAIHNPAPPRKSQWANNSNAADVCKPLVGLPRLFATADLSLWASRRKPVSRVVLQSRRQTL